MAFLFIEKPIEDIIQSLEWEQRTLESTVAETQDDVCIEYLSKINDKLRCAETYRAMHAKKGAYHQIKHLRWKDPEKYLENCREQVKDIKGIDFVKKSMRFRVRISRNGAVKQLGEFDTPQDAIEVLGAWMK